MSTVDIKIVEACLQGMDCKNCPTCHASLESWRKLEQDFAEGNTNYVPDLEIYYQVKAKRKIFEQTKNGGYLTLSEPEMLNMMSRY